MRCCRSYCNAVMMSCGEYLIWSFTLHFWSSVAFRLPNTYRHFSHHGFLGRSSLCVVGIICSHTWQWSESHCGRGAACDSPGKGKKNSVNSLFLFSNIPQISAAVCPTAKHCSGNDITLCHTFTLAIRFSASVMSPGMHWHWHKWMSAIHFWQLRRCVTTVCVIRRVLHECKQSHSWSHSVVRLMPRAAVSSMNGQTIDFYKP